MFVVNIMHLLFYYLIAASAIRHVIILSVLHISLSSLCFFPIWTASVALAGLLPRDSDIHRSSGQ